MTLVSWSVDWSGGGHPQLPSLDIVIGSDRRTNEYVDPRRAEPSGSGWSRHDAFAITRLDGMRAEHVSFSDSKSIINRWE